MRCYPSEGKRQSAAMSENPKCPNCNGRMRMVRRLSAKGEEPEVFSYECDSCRVGFITEDHLPVAGPSV